MTKEQRTCERAPIEPGDLTYQPGCGGKCWTKNDPLVELYPCCHWCGGEIEEVETAHD